MTVLFSFLFAANANAIEEPNLKFKRIVHNKELLTQLENSRVSFLAFPAFMKSPGNQVLELQADFSKVNLFSAQQGFAALISSGDLLVTIGGSCTSYFFGSSSCDSLVFFSSSTGNARINKLKAASGLDQHDLVADGSKSFWGMRYVIKDCQDNMLLCGGSRKPANVKKFADCEIIKFNLNGDILKSWSAANSLPTSEILWDFWKDDIFQTSYADPFHCNSLDFNRINNKLLVSMRHTNSIYSIDIEKNHVDWKIGGSYLPETSLTSKISKPELIFAGQHDARWVSDRSISLFDNATNTGRPAKGMTISIQNGYYKVLGLFEDPTKSESQCTGSFRRFNSNGEIFFIAGWGCSENGATVFTVRGKPVVSIMLDSVSNSPYTPFDSGPQKILNSVLSYRIYPNKR